MKVVTDQLIKLGINKRDVRLESNLTDDLNLDSLDTVELVMEMEKKYNIAISDAKAEKLKTVGNVVDHLFENAKDGVADGR